MTLEELNQAAEELKKYGAKTSVPFFVVETGEGIHETLTKENNGQWVSSEYGKFSNLDEYAKEFLKRWGSFDKAGYNRKLFRHMLSEALKEHGFETEERFCMDVFKPGEKRAPQDKRRRICFVSIDSLSSVEINFNKFFFDDPIALEYKTTVEGTMDFILENIADKIDSVAEEIWKKHESAKSEGV